MYSTTPGLAADPLVARLDQDPVEVVAQRVVDPVDRHLRQAAGDRPPGVEQHRAHRGAEPGCRVPAVAVDGRVDPVDRGPDPLQRWGGAAVDGVVEQEEPGEQRGQQAQVGLVGVGVEAAGVAGEAAVAQPLRRCRSRRRARRASRPASPARRRRAGRSAAGWGRTDRASPWQRPPACAGREGSPGS